MNEQDEQRLAVVQNADEGLEQFKEVADGPSPAPLPTPSRTPRRFAPTWFLLGVIVGIVGTLGFSAIVGIAAYTTLAARPTTAASAIDAVAMRGAARDGVIEAIATLQAGGGQQQPTAKSQEPTVVDPSQFTLRAANTINNPGAKVTIVEFSDFQCPFCGRFHSTVEAQLMKDYVQTGQVTFVYKHSAFLGQESVWSAQAAECAADQGKFWIIMTCSSPGRTARIKAHSTKTNSSALPKKWGWTWPSSSRA